MRVREASLILTVLNEAESLPAFLSGIERQSVLPAEIVVVDGGSTDGTMALLRAWDVPEPCVLIVDQIAGAGISEGRNRAIELASHDIVLVTDGGTTLEPRWAERLIAAFDAETSPDVVSGFFEPVGAAFLERTIAFTVTPALGEIDPERFLPSSRSLGVRREAWRRAGGYPEWLDYCEDLVFDLALKRAGARFVFEPEARVTWSARPTLRGFGTQYYRYARGDGKAGLWAKRHLVRYATYGGSAVAAGLSFSHPWLLVVLGVGFVAYMRKFWGRILGRRAQFGRGWLRAAAIAPVIVVAGDLAKIAGYPAGLLWRRRSGGRG